MRILDEGGHEPPRRGAGKILWIGALMVLVLAAAGYYFFVVQPGERAAPREAAEPPVTEPEEPPPPEPEPVEPSGPVATTGSLQVSANVSAARVFLDGEAVGETPFALEELEPGAHRLRVEKPGYQPFEQEIRITAGRRREIRADLSPSLASLRIESDVPGAQVFLDREYKGTTPLELEGIEPGSYQLTVSAEGHEMYAESLELGTEPREVNVRFLRPRLDQSIAVVHKHTFGSCEGRLVADAEGLRYETSNKNDAFAVAFSAVERFEVDYLDKNLNVKIRGGKNYNFTEESGDPDPLYVFHREVQEFMQRTGANGARQ